MVHYARDRVAALGVAIALTLPPGRLVIAVARWEIARDRLITAPTKSP
jgi:hypothetical protein